MNIKFRTPTRKSNSAAKTFNILGLPPELRLLVYIEYSLFRPLRITVQPRENTKTKGIRQRLRSVYRRRRWNSMALLFSNRTLRNGAISTIYQNATLIFAKPRAWVMGVGVTTLGSYARSIWLEILELMSSVSKAFANASADIGPDQLRLVHQMDFPNLASFILLIGSAAVAQHRYDPNGEIIVSKCDEYAVLETITYIKIKDDATDVCGRYRSLGQLDHDSATIVMMVFPRLEHLVFDTRGVVTACTVKCTGE